MIEIYIGKKLAFFGDKMFVRRVDDVVIIADEGKRVVKNEFYEDDRLKELLGLDKPMARIKARTGCAK